MPELGDGPPKPRPQFIEPFPDNYKPPKNDIVTRGNDLIHETEAARSRVQLAAERFIRNVETAQSAPRPQEEVARQAGHLAELSRVISPDQLRGFLNSPTVQHNLEQFMEIDPSDIQDALTAENPEDALTRMVSHEVEETTEVERRQPVRYLVSEPKARKSESDGIFLSGKERKLGGLEQHDVVTVRVGDKTLEVRVEPAKKRDNGQIEGEGSSYLRLAPALFDELNLPYGYAVGADFRIENGVLTLTPLDSLRWNRQMVREGRVFSESIELEEGTISLCAEDLNQFGIQEGEEIVGVFGKGKRGVRVVASSDMRSVGVSSDVREALGISTDLRLRMSYDKDTRELRWGPSIAMYAKLNGEEGDIKTRIEMFKPMSKQAQKYGVFLSILDPDVQNPDVIAQGMVDAYVMDEKEGVLKPVRIPIPDVVYDKKVGSRSDIGKSLTAQVEHHVTPVAEQVKTGDKYTFTRLMKKHGLGEYHPNTLNLKEVTADQADTFFQNNPNVLLKPRRGAGAMGHIRIEKTDEGYIIKQITGRGEDGKAIVEKSTVESGEQLISVLSENRLIVQYGGIGSYIAQEEIDFAKYRYTDPETGLEETGGVEIREVMQRRIDGEIKTGSLISKLIQDKPRAHKETLVRVLKSLYNGDEAMVKAKLGELEQLSTKVYKALEEEIGEQMGEVTFDIGLRSDGRFCFFEPNAKGSNYPYLTNATEGKPDTLHLQDSRNNLLVGPIEYALYKTYMN